MALAEELAPAGCLPSRGCVRVSGRLSVCLPVARGGFGHPAGAGQAKALLTVEEHVKSGGFGSAVLELLAENNVSCPVKLLGLPDRFIEHDKIDNLLCRCGLDKQGIKNAMAELVQRRRQNDSKQTKA